MLDRFNREVDYLRISVTDRCNQRCIYCMPEEGVKLLRHEDVLTFEEMDAVVKAGLELGINKVRLTGGEPLIKRDIVKLVEILAANKGIKDLSMTTNGVLLAKFADSLRSAGLQRLNVSLDTLDPEKYHQITRGGDLSQVLEGLEVARKLGFKQIKLNCVIQTSPDEPDAVALAKFAAENDCQVQFIRRMNMAAGEFWRVEGGSGGVCDSCGRLRLSSDGRIFPCLFNDIYFSVRELGPKEALCRAIEMKPEFGASASNHNFHSLGG